MWVMRWWWCAMRDLTRHEVPQSRTNFCSATHQKNLRRETENKKISFSFGWWCATRDLNPHAVAKEPKSFVSANSTSRARCLIFYYYTPEKQLIQYQISQIKRQILYLRLVFFQFRYIFYIWGNFKTPQKSWSAPALICKKCSCIFNFLNDFCYYLIYIV